MRPGSVSRKANRAICERIAFVALIGLACISPAAARPMYTILPANTYIFSINDNGAAAGSFGVNTGFLRTPDGTITMFQMPDGAQELDAFSINSSDAITGYYQNESGVYHGFVRTADGTITTFDAPNAGSGAGQGTFAYSINTSGTSVGLSIDNAGAEHGVIRNPDGGFVTFDVQHAKGTTARSINDKGLIAGTYTDLHSITHSFVRTPNGRITKFDAPGNNLSTGVAAISSKGVITGEYMDEDHAKHGYIRATDGSFTEFDSPGLDTFPTALNAKGTIVGQYLSANLKHGYGFVRNSNGATDTLHIPQTKGTLLPETINTSGVIAGAIFVPTGNHQTTHYGFIRTP